MDLNRAFSAFEIRAVDEERRVITGIATSPKPDRMDDVVEPLGLTYAKSIPLFLYHDSAQQVGTARLGKATKNGVPFEASIVKVSEAGRLKEMADEAWQRVKYKLITAVSIGFRPNFDKIETLKTGGFRFLEAEVLELSLVPIPAQPDATIDSVKALYMKSITATSGRSTTQPARAGASQTQGKTMKTYTQDALAALEQSRETKAKRMEELREVKSTESRRFTDEERAEFDGLDSEIEDLDDEIRVTRRHMNISKSARPVDGGSRAPAGFVKKLNDVEEKFQGETGLKRALANVVAMSEIKQGRFITPTQVVERMWGKTNPTLVAVMKAGVAGAGTDSGEWGAELAAVDNRYTGDFIEYLYGMTVFDQLPLRRVPHNVSIKGQDGAFTGYFVGQSKAIPVSAGDFSASSTVPYKAAGLCVVSNEWLRDASGDGLQLCGQGLREAVAQAVDSRFLSTTALSAGVAPAGILNGVSIFASNGADAQSVATDIKALFAPFISAKNLSGGLAWVMSPTTAVALSLMRNALGQAEYPTINGNGGTFMGYPVFVGDNVGSGDVILLKPSDIWKIGDLGVSLSTSDSAMIEQDSAPTGETDTPAAASATMVSMFQEDSTAIKVVRAISWGKRRASAVAYIGDAAYGAEQS